MTQNVHGVLTKNKNYAKIFYSRPYNNLPQKIPCGWGTIFARGAHFRAILGGPSFFKVAWASCPCFFPLMAEG
jgi:hypothetical protein